VCFLTSDQKDNLIYKERIRWTVDLITPFLEISKQLKDRRTDFPLEVTYFASTSLVHIFSMLSKENDNAKQK